MRQIYSIGKWAYLVTLGFYCFALIGLFFSYLTGSRDPSIAYLIGVFLGLLTQVALGVIHLVLVLYVYFDFKKLKTEDKTYLYGYTIMLPAFFIGWWFLANTDYFNDIFCLVLFFIALPMLIGGYFVYVLSRIKKSELTMQSKTEILNV